MSHNVHEYPGGEIHYPAIRLTQADEEPQLAPHPWLADFTPLEEAAR